MNAREWDKLLLETQINFRDFLKKFAKEWYGNRYRYLVGEEEDGVQTTEDTFGQDRADLV